jgi:hypothetical protein
MKLRVAAVAALACVTALTVPSGAAAKTSCKLVTDPAGDTYAYRNAGQAKVPDASLDLTGGDIASNTKAVTVVFRVAKLAVPSPTSPQGVRFYAEVSPTTADDVFYFEGDITAATKTFYVGYQGASLQVTQVRPQLGAATGVVDTAHNEVRITAPLSLFVKRGAKFTARTKWTSLTLFTGRMVASANSVTGSAVAPFADDAVAAKSYLHNTPSCVKVGK